MDLISLPDDIVCLIMRKLSGYECNHLVMMSYTCKLCNQLCSVDTLLWGALWTHQEMKKLEYIFNKECLWKDVYKTQRRDHEWRNITRRTYLLFDQLYP